MRSKAPLILMEQIIMLLVFALAAALCLQAFVRSDAASRRSEARDHAVALCQSVAETIQHNGGDLPAAAEQLGFLYGAYAQEEPAFSVHYGEDWAVSDTRDYAYCLRAEPVDSGIEGLGKASVLVSSEEFGELFALEVVWQEVGGGE